jgi:hypothetical protein
LCRLIIKKKGIIMLPPREELMTMPITVLEHQNIENAEEEKLVQEILDLRRSQMPPQKQVYNNDAIQANISTKEDEAKWQKVIDERKAKLQGMISTSVTATTSPTVNAGPYESIHTEQESVSEVNPMHTKVFCKFCNFNGFRHKLNCTRPK